MFSGIGAKIRLGIKKLFIDASTDNEIKLVNESGELVPLSVAEGLFHHSIPPKRKMEGFINNPDFGIDEENNIFTANYPMMMHGAVLRNYSERVLDLGEVSGTQILDFSQASVFKMKIIAETTIQFSGHNTNPELQETVALIISGGNIGVNLPPIQTIDGEEILLSSGIDKLIVTHNGTEWAMFKTGENYIEPGFRYLRMRVAWERMPEDDAHMIDIWTPVDEAMFALEWDKSIRFLKAGNIVYGSDHDFPGKGEGNHAITYSYPDDTFSVSVDGAYTITDGIVTRYQFLHYGTYPYPPVDYHRFPGPMFVFDFQKKVILDAIQAENGYKSTVFYDGSDPAKNTITPFAIEVSNDPNPISEEWMEVTSWVTTMKREQQTSDQFTYTPKLPKARYLRIRLVNDASNFQSTFIFHVSELQIFDSADDQGNNILLNKEPHAKSYNQAYSVAPVPFFLTDGLVRDHKGTENIYFNAASASVDHWIVFDLLTRKDIGFIRYLQIDEHYIADGGGTVSTPWTTQVMTFAFEISDNQHYWREVARVEFNSSHIGATELTALASYNFHHTLLPTLPEYQ